MQRPSKDDYYMSMAKSVCARATCMRFWVGAVIIKDDQVISTGYNGAPRGTKDSYEHGFCLREKLKIPHGQRYETCRSVHAEMNAVINAARAGTCVLGGKMYLYGHNPKTDTQEDAFPCFICKKIIINAGLSSVVCSLKDGNMIEFKVADWVKDWSEHDIIDDKIFYGKDKPVE